MDSLSRSLRQIPNTILVTSKFDPTQVEIFSIKINREESNRAKGTSLGTYV